MSALNLCHKPPPPGPELPIIRLKAGESVTCVILSRSMWGVLTHWDGARTEPCYAEKAQCGGCRKGYPTRWKGYLHVFLYGKKREAFIELTPTAAAFLENVMPTDVMNMRGQTIYIERMKGDKSRLKVTLMNAAPDASIYPEDRDPEKTLCYLWNVKRIHGPRSEKFGTDQAEAI